MPELTINPAGRQLIVRALQYCDVPLRIGPTADSLWCGYDIDPDGAHAREIGVLAHFENLLCNLKTPSMSATVFPIRTRQESWH